MGIELWQIMFEIPKLKPRIYLCMNVTALRKVSRVIVINTSQLIAFSKSYYKSD